VRDLVQQNPAYLQPLIQQLAATNPQLAEQLNAHPEMLYQLFGGVTPGDLQGEGEGGPPFAIHVTEEEHAAIQRVRFEFVILARCI
jgi:UV excision repair protein RAD23